MNYNSSSSTTFKPLDGDTLIKEAQLVANLIADYYKNIEKYPVKSQVIPGYLKKLIDPQCVPNTPEALETILEDVKTKIFPGLTHWQSPNFYAYYPANASNAAFLGEMLCTGLNVVGFNWVASPAAAELESIMMDWMAKMLELPKEFLFSGNGGGVLYASTEEAILCTLAAARDRALNFLGAEKITKLVVYCSDQTHFSFQKTAKLVGISPCNIRVLPTSFSTGFALLPDDVQAAMEADSASGYVPLYLCATVGTTASCAVDPIKDLGNVTEDFGAWFHIDAAYAGNACICPEYRHFIDGVELADSISMNPHKWLLTNMDCCCMWLKNPKMLTDSLSTNPEILRNKVTDQWDINVAINYKDWQMALSRRFRAIKLWLVIRRHGLNNLRSHIRSDIEMAKHFESLVVKDDRFELVVPRKFALVCFRLRPRDRNDGTSINKKLMEAINSSGEAYLTHAVLGGKFAIRCAIGTTLTELCHVDKLWKLIQEKCEDVSSQLQ